MTSRVARRPLLLLLLLPAAMPPSAAGLTVMGEEGQRGQGLRPCEEQRLRATRMESYGHTHDAGLKAAGLDAVYVAHYSPYKSRRQYMERALDSVGLQALFVTGWDREELSDEDVACMYPSNALFESEATRLNYPLSWLKTGELGLAMKHAAAFYDAVRKGHRNILVLEDDAVLVDNFAQELKQLLQHQQVRNYDLLFLGSFWPDTPEGLAKSPRIIKDGGPKGTVGYLASLKGAQHFMAHMPIHGPSDHMVSHDYTNPPPVRLSRRPWLVWQGSREDSWRQSVHAPIAFKGHEFVMATEQQPCSGCACPGEVTHVSAHLVRSTGPSTPAAKLGREAKKHGEGLLSLSRWNTSAMGGLDKDYVAAVINAGYACTAEEVLHRELVNLEV